MVSRTRFSDAKFRGGFSLIEILVVIAIVAILMALLFPAFTGVQDQAKRTQAKNDIAQIVTAVNAFYAEYGQYPCDAQTGNEGADFFAADDNANNTLFDILRGDPTNGNVQTYNPKAIAFFQPTIAKDPAYARHGLAQIDSLELVEEEQREALRLDLVERRDVLGEKDDTVTVEQDVGAGQ